MGLLDRFRRSPETTDPAPRVRALPDPGEAPADSLPLKPEGRRLDAAERATLDERLAELAAEGVDVDDLASIGAGLDRALDAFEQSPDSDPDPVVARYAAAVGEHLARRSDLSWQVVTDVFGTDLAVAAGDFVVVPSNLVAVRWMRRERGWVPGVVGHLVRIRQR